MGYEEILDGEEHWLALGEWPGWVVPHTRAVEEGAIDPQPEYEPYEGPLTNLVKVGDLSAEAFFTSGDHGWGAFSIMLQSLADALDVPVDVAQYVTRDNRWKVTAEYHKVVFGKGPIGSGGFFDEDDDVVDVYLPEGL